MYNKNTTVIVLALLVTFILYLSNHLKMQNIVALILVIGLSFVAPLASMVVMIPVALLVYMQNYKVLGEFWSTIKQSNIS